MSTLTDQDIKKIGHLSRIAIDPNAVESLKNDLNKILGMVDQLDSADTSQAQPLAHAIDTTAYLREDKVMETNQREAFQSIAPVVKAGLYIVPAAIE